jgi:hypothetical protein
MLIDKATGKDQFAAVAQVSLLKLLELLSEGKYLPGQLPVTIIRIKSNIPVLDNSLCAFDRDGPEQFLDAVVFGLDGFGGDWFTCRFHN